MSRKVTATASLVFALPLMLVVTIANSPPSLSSGALSTHQSAGNFGAKIHLSLVPTRSKDGILHESNNSYCIITILNEDSDSKLKVTTQNTGRGALSRSEVTSNCNSIDTQ